MADSRWSDDELRAAVAAYIKMLRLEARTQPYKKSQIRGELMSGPLKARSKGSIERRMSNISWVLQSHGLPWIKGYKPLSNVGPSNRPKIEKYLADDGLLDKNLTEPTTDAESLEAKTEILMNTFGDMILQTVPSGRRTVPQTTRSSKGYIRDAMVRCWVLEKAGGTCEACGRPGPFKTERGAFYLEIHHVKRLAEGGPDTIDNTVAVCPNCHRRLHHAADKVRYADALYKRCARLKRPSG